MIDSVTSGAPVAHVEIGNDNRTLKQRTADPLAFFDLLGTSNSPTDATNGRLDHRRKTALGFHNLSRYIATKDWRLPPTFSIMKRQIRPRCRLTERLACPLFPRFGFMIHPLNACETDLLELATFENMNWCGDRTTLDDVRPKLESLHCTRILSAHEDFGDVTGVEGEVAGMAWAGFLPSSDAGYEFIVEQIPDVGLWVSAEQRQRGLSRQLLRALAEEATSRRLKQISLSVEASNHAKQLYASEGYIDVPGGEADGVMLLTLQSASGRCALFPHSSHASMRSHRLVSYA